MTETDEQLIARFSSGDADAFPLLYQRHKDALYAFLLRQVGNQAVDELFQDTWEKVISHADSFQQQASFRTWLYQIARHKAIDHWRGRRQLQSLDDVELAAPADPEADAHRHQAQHQIRICLSKLPLYQREAVLLKESGFSVKELAAIASVGLETAKSRLKLAYRQLRACLEVYREPA